jgi:Flp pilus assembly protein TadG
MNANHSFERGQVLILLAIGFVVFLGFVALAIDGGMVFSDRRHSQNAADASSLAGAGAAALSLEDNGVNYANWNDCANPNIPLAQQAAVTAAVTRAGANGFVITSPIANRHGVETECGVQDNGGWEDRYIDITTDISSTTRTNFAQVFYGGRLINNVAAVTRVRPRTPLAFGHAIVALNREDCQGNQNGVIFGGSADVSVNGGGVFSNGCLGGNGGAFNVEVTNGSVVYVEDLDPPGNPPGTGLDPNIEPNPAQVPSPLPSGAYYVAPPDCTPGDDVYIHNTTYNGTTPLEPGLHCFYAQPNAIKINAGTTLNATGVTLYVVNGGVTINGGATINLSAPPPDPDPSPAIAGMLLFLAPGNDSTIGLEGGAQSAYLGTIYAPDGDISVSGANGTHPTFNTQLIAQNVFVSGNASIDINFDAGMNYNRPAYIELFR